MKTQISMVLGGWLCLGAALVGAQEPMELEEIKKQLEEATRSFNSSIKEQQQVIDDLRKRLDAAEKREAVAVPPPDLPPSNPLRVGNSQRYLDLSLDGLFAAGTSTADDLEALQPGGHDPNQRGFTVQNIEAVFSGAVDPYFRAQANLILQIDGDGETVIELEEAYGETVSLPWNLQLRAGQFFSGFGRHNPSHPHTWTTVDQPLVAGRFFGPDGLRNPGARLSWLVPTPFYSEFFISVQDSQGETAESFRSDHEGEVFLGRVHEAVGVRSLGDLLFVPRYALSLDLSDSQTLLAGASAAFGPNASGEDADTQIYGVDLFWKWKSPRHDQGFPFVSWQTEGLLRKYEAGAFSEDIDGDTIIDVDVDEDGVIDSVPGETLTDYGFYSQISYGFKRGWVAGFRGGYVARSDQAEYEAEFGDDPDRADRWRLSPSLTWYPSHFSKVRLQYNYDRRDQIGDDHSVWLQFEFVIGSHGGHTF